MAADLSSKKANYISRVQSATDALLAQITALEALTLEGQSQGWVAPSGGTASAPLADADFTGSNGFLSAAAFANVMATLSGLDSTLHANNAAILSSLFQMRR